MCADLCLCSGGISACVMCSFSCCVMRSFFRCGHCSLVGYLFCVLPRIAEGVPAPLSSAVNFIIFNRRIKIKWPQKGYADHSTVFCPPSRGGPERSQNSAEWSAYPFCNHFILILQLNVIIKLARRTEGGYPFSNPQNWPKRSCLPFARVFEIQLQQWLS